MLGQPDLDQSNTPDGLMANWRSYDYESGVQWHAWTITDKAGAELIQDANLDNAYGMPVDWAALQRNVTSVFFDWATVPGLLMARKDGLTLSKGTVYYAAGALRARGETRRLL